MGPGLLEAALVLQMMRKLVMLLLFLLFPSTISHQCEINKNVWVPVIQNITSEKGVTHDSVRQDTVPPDGDNSCTFCLVEARASHLTDTQIC
jgi:hypothetical protein